MQSFRRVILNPTEKSVTTNLDGDWNSMVTIIKWFCSWFSEFYDDYNDEKLVTSSTKTLQQKIGIDREMMQKISSTLLARTNAYLLLMDVFIFHIQLTTIWYQKNTAQIQGGELRIFCEFPCWV